MCDGKMAAKVRFPFQFPWCELTCKPYTASLITETYMSMLPDLNQGIYKGEPGLSLTTVPMSNDFDKGKAGCFKNEYSNRSGPTKTKIKKWDWLKENVRKIIICRSCNKLSQINSKYKMQYKENLGITILLKMKDVIQVIQEDEQGEQEICFKKYSLILRMVPPSQNCRFCENCFWHNLKTNEVKYIKVYIFRKEIQKESI